MNKSLLTGTSLAILLMSSQVFAQTPISISTGTVNITEGISNNVETNVNTGGAVTIDANISTVSFASNLSFDNNQSTGVSGSSGGAIKALNGFTTGNGLSITNNYTTGAGGAIYIRLSDNSNYSSIGYTASNRNIVIGKNAVFSGNNAGWMGGALAVESAQNVSIGDNAQFTSNIATLKGGAISVWTDTTNKYNGSQITLGNTVTIGKNALFQNNQASDGGAISIEKDGDLTNTVIIGADTTFKNNTVSGLGGAIYNEDVLEFNGNVTFEGNTAGGSANAIHMANGSTLNINSGIAKIYDGISTAGTNNINVRGTSTFDIGTSAANVSNITFDASSTFMTTLNQPTAGNFGSLNATTITTNGAKISLIVDKNTQTGDYTVVNGTFANDETFTFIANKLYNISTSDGKTFTVDGMKDSGEIAQSVGANSNQANTLIAVIGSGQTGNATFDNVSNDINNLLQSGESGERQALDAITAMAPEATSMIQTSTTQNVNQVFGAIGSRLSGGSTSVSEQGISSGDGDFEKLAVWVQGLVNRAKLSNSSSGRGFKANSSGIAFGMEAEVMNNMLAGVGYAYTKTDIDGFLRKTRVETNTAFLYGEYKPSDWFINAMASYNWGDYEEKRFVAGNKVSADYDVNSIGLQVMTGYDFMIRDAVLTPEVGARYVHIKQDAYTDTLDQRVASGTSDILTGVLGAKVSQKFNYDGTMMLRPELRAALTYDFHKDDGTSVVTLANGNGYSVNGKSLKRFGVEAGAGITAEVNNIEVGIAYEGKFREDYRDHTGLLNVKYKF